MSTAPIDWRLSKIEILVDYFRFTSKVHSLSEITELLGIESVDWVPGKSRDGWSIHDYSNGMHIYHGTRDDIGVELSGVGCRMLETINQGAFDWIELFGYIMDKGSEMNVSRLDIAGDDKDGCLSMAKMVAHTSARKYISKARRCIWIAGDEQEILYGSKSSDTRLRIYNKALERNVEGHWIRVEFQFRDDAADSFILNFLRVKEIGLTYGGVLLNYLRYTTKNPELCNNNRDRLETAPWWDKFVKTAEKIQNIRVGGLEYNYFDLEGFLVKQCASSLKAYVKANGGSFEPLKKIIDDAKINKKQEEMLSQLNVTKTQMDTAFQQVLNNREAGYAEVSVLDFQRSEHIRDSFGVRWVKCKKCGKIKQDSEMSYYGGIGQENFGFCSCCSRVKM